MINQVYDTGSGEPLALLVIALSALLLFTASDYLVGICKLFLEFRSHLCNICCVQAFKYLNSTPGHQKYNYGINNQLSTKV
jgi:hypothetical protein